MQLKHLVWPALLSAVVSAQEDQGTTPSSTDDLVTVLGNTPELSTLTSVLSRYPALLEQLGSATNITILAPSNSAFEKLLASPAGAAISANDTSAITALLTYHVVQGVYPASSILADSPGYVATLLRDNPQYVNVTGGQVVQLALDGDDVVVTSGLQATTSVETADVAFAGGIVHVIEDVLTLPLSLATTASQNPDFSTLVSALSAANLVSALDTASDLTVFAPTNEAFARIGSALRNITIDALTQILAYHVVNGTVAYSTDLSDGQTIEAANGEDLTIRITDDDIFVNSAQVAGEVIVANGVVHVIDNVLNPANPTASPDPNVDDENSGAFPGASSASFTLPTGTATGTATGTTTTGSTTTTQTGSTTTNASNTAANASGVPSGATGAAAPLQTGGMGMAALLGAGAAMLLV